MSQKEASRIFLWSKVIQFANCSHDKKRRCPSIIFRDSILDVCINLDIEVKEQKVNIKKYCFPWTVYSSLVLLQKCFLRVSAFLRPEIFSEADPFSEISSKTYLKSYWN